MHKLKRNITVITTTLLVIATLLSGCVSKSSYDPLKADNDSLKEINAQYEQELTTEKGINQGLRQQLNEKIEKNKVIQAELTLVRENIAELEARNIQSSNEVKRLNKLLTQINEELNKLREKYPLNNFSSYSELETWASSHLIYYDYYSDKSEYQACYDVAIQAINDGYIVFVDVDPGDEFMYSWCVAIVGNHVYFWNVHKDHYDGLKKIEWLAINSNDS